jgi:hypothetical protein
MIAEKVWGNNPKTKTGGAVARQKKGEKHEKRMLKMLLF